MNVVYSTLVLEETKELWQKCVLVLGQALQGKRQRESVQSEGGRV